MPRAFLTLVTASALMLGLPAVAAERCGKAEFGAVIDDTGAKLRKLNSDTQPRIQARMRELGARHGWAESEIEEKAYHLLLDEETRSLDEQAGELLARFDRLGDEGPEAARPCERLAELKTVAAQVLEVTAAKSAHVSVRLEAALRPAVAATPPAPVKPPAAKTAPQPEPKADPKIARPAAPPPPAKTAPSAAPVPWQTETSRETSPSKPDVRAVLPPRVEASPEQEFTVEDIQAAGRGFFGSISAGLASVIEYAFQQYGRPNGYMLGREGGGAFLAGLRYGQGKMVTKAHGEQKVFWQGPSVGYDFGLAGSRVMVLVYNLRNTEEIYTRFAGIDGSAYLVGGVGITFLKKGRLVLAPIRTGLGLRLGANIGYLKFTPQASLNPF